MLALNLLELHIDMMDYHFTPNFGLSIDVCQSILQHFPETRLDVHLMTSPTRPELISDLADMGVTDITVHLNTLSQALIQQLKAHHSINLRIAISHDDSLDKLISHPDFLTLNPSRLLVLAVTPGFCGQAMQPAALSIAKQAIALGFDTMVDGGVNLSTSQDIRKLQPQSVVVGGGLFNQPLDKQKMLISQLTDPQD